MQAEESPRAVTPERSGLKPTTAFLLLLLGAALVGVVFYLSRPDPAPTPTGDTTHTAPNFALTNEEAITRFQELNALLSEAYANRDVTLFEMFLTDDSPLNETGGTEIRRLLRDNVIPVPKIEFSSIEVRSLQPEEIVIRAIEIDESHFVSDGRDVSEKANPIKRTVDWTLRLETSQWLLHDSVIVRSRTIKN